MGDDGCPLLYVILVVLISGGISNAREIIYKGRMRELEKSIRDQRKDSLMIPNRFLSKVRSILLTVFPLVTKKYFQYIRLTDPYPLQIAKNFRGCNKIKETIGY